MIRENKYLSKYSSVWSLYHVGVMCCCYYNLLSKDLYELFISDYGFGVFTKSAQCNIVDFNQTNATL